MKLEQVRPGVYRMTVTTHEVSALLAGARMSLDLMRTDPGDVTKQARDALASVLADFDRALAAINEERAP